jgi:probable phosphoglycerate mutase
MPLDHNPESALDPKALKNRYFIMRHGRSLANEEGLIVSSPLNGLTGYGLAGKGREQIRSSLEAQTLLDSDTLIVASDFLRTRESAALAAEILKTAPIRTCEELRERNFGDFELKKDENYGKVWASDEGNDGNKEHNVESPREVQARFRSAIARFESEYGNRTILLISHGDLLQIAQTWFEGTPPCRHRSLSHLETAEIRALNAPA